MSGGDVAVGLRAWSTHALVEELARRSARPPEERHNPIPQCDQCKHFIAWSANDNPPAGYNPCELGHKLNFKLPDGPTDDDWGFYRRICADRIATLAQSAVQS